MKSLARVWFLVLLLASAVLAACGGGSEAPSIPPQGTVRVGLTDAPGCRVGNADIARVFVTVQKVRIHALADAGESGPGWSEIVLSPARRIDLLQLTNGTLEPLGSTPVPAGSYSQVRLVLAANDNAAPYANALVLAGSSTELPLATPSAMQSGLKVIRPFAVAANAVVDLVIDFDACRSIVARGNGSYSLKPTMMASVRSVAAIQGHVDPAVPGVLVSAQKNGEVLRSTVPAADGKFVLAYLDPALSPFDVVLTAPARTTTVVSSVPASNSGITLLNGAGAPLAMPLSGVNLASGQVSPLGARDTAWVRALQSVGPVPRVEVAWTNVGPVDGSYVASLPTAAPRWAPYASSGLFFQVQAAQAAAYTLQAGATGYVVQDSPPLSLIAPRIQDFFLIAAP